MYTIKTLNKISPLGLEKLSSRGFCLDDSASAPEGILVRSAAMHDMELPASLLAVARAGAGVNITPVAFLVVRGESVRMLPVAEPASASMDRLIEQLPDLLDKAESLMKQKRLAKEEESVFFPACNI